MPKTCGLAVDSSSINLSFIVRLFTQHVPHPTTAEYKSSTTSPAFPQLMRPAVHSFFAHFTPVLFVVVHTIHSTNKNYKNFFMNNLLLIYRKAV